MNENLMEFEENLQPKVNSISPMAGSLLKSKNYFQKLKKFIKTIKNSDSKLDSNFFDSFVANLRVSIPMLNSADELEDLYCKCFSKIPKIKKKKKNQTIEKWKKNQVVVFVWILCEYSFLEKTPVDTFKDEEWKYISSLLPPEITPDKCKYKWFCLKKSSALCEEWTEFEDNLLRQLVKKYEMIFNNRKSFKWSKIAKELNLKRSGTSIRLGKHCRERWNNHLDPSISKEKWSSEEDLCILQCVDKFGKKWSKISKKMKGRHENAVKNRYISIMRALRKQAKRDYKKKFDPTNTKSAIDAFLANKTKLISPIKKENKEKNKKNNEIKNEITFQPPLPIQESLNALEPTNNEEQNLQMNPLDQNHIKRENKLIYDVSNCFLPNMYLAENNKFSPKKQENFLKLIIQENPFFEIDDISQNMSSMSLSDQLLNEANKILSTISSSIGENSFFSSINNEKSSSLLSNSKEYEQRMQSLLTPIFNDLGNLSPRSSFLFRCQTQNVNAPQENNFDLKAKKKKSFTVRLHQT